MTAVTEDLYLATPMSESVGRANRAATLAERAQALLARDGDNRADELAERALRLARLAGAAAKRAERAEEFGPVAERAATECEAVALEIVALDTARLGDLDPNEVWTEPGLEASEVKVEQAVAERAEAEAQACEADPSKRASRGRYNKGCRCEACRAANKAHRRKALAQKGGA